MAKISDLIIKLIVDSKGAVKGIAETETYLERLAKKTGDLSDITVSAMAKSSDATQSSMEQWIDGMRKAEGNLKDVGSKLNKWVTIPLLGVGTGAIVAAKDFESAFAGVKKTVDATDSEFEMLSTSIKEMSMELPFAATGIAGVAEAAGQLGIETPYIMDFTRVMTDLGVATNLSAEQAATSLARFVNIMGTSHEEYSNMGSAVVDLGNNFATTESEIVNMSMRLAGAGRQLNMSEADIFGLSTALTSMGLTAEAGGTAMTKWMTAMQVASTEGYTKMRELQDQTGLTARDLELMQSNSSKRFKTLADDLDMTTQELGRTVKAGRDLEKMADVMGVSVEQAADIIKNDAAGALALFFDGLAANNAEGTTTIEILNEMGINEVRLRDALLKSGSARELINEALFVGNKAYRENTALTEEASQRYETLDSRLTMLKNTINVIFINLGEQMLPLIKELTEWLQQVAKKIATMDPEKFQSAVKLLSKLALAGPALKIAGSAVGTVASGFERIAKTSSAITNLVKAGIFREKGITVPDGYVGGGWDAMKMFDAKVTSASQGKVYTERFGVINKEYTELMNRLNDEQKKFMKAQYDSVSAMDKFRVSISSAKNAAFDFGKTTQATGIYMGSLVAYTVKAVATNKDFRYGLGEIGSSITGVISKLTGLNIGLAEVGVAASTLFMVITNSNPIFAVTTGLVVGLVKAIEAYGERTRLAKEYNASFAESMNNIDDKFAQTSSTAEKLAMEVAPELTNKFQALDNMFKEEGFLNNEENLVKMKENFDEYTTSTLAAFEEYTNTRLEAVKVTSDNETSLERETLDTLKAMIEGAHKDAETEYNKHADAALEIQERLSSGRYTDRKKEEEDLQYHLNEMKRITDEFLLGQIADGEMSYLNRAAAMRTYFMEEGELTEDQIETLTEMQKEFIHEEIRLQTQKHIDKQKELQKAFDLGKITEEEFNRGMDALRKDFARDELMIVTKSGHETVKAITGFKDQEINAYWEHKEKVEGLQKELAETSNYKRQEEINAELEKLRQYEKNDEKLMKIHKGYEEYLKTMPKEYRTYFKAASGEMHFSEGMNRLQGYSKNTWTYGQAAAQGYAGGMRSKMSVVESAARDLGYASNVVLQEYLKVNSPSRVFMGLGNSVSEGFAKGIDDLAYLAEDATYDMGKAVSDTEFDVPALSGEFKTRHIRENVVEQSFTMANQVGNAVVDALGKAKIRAYVGEEDFEEGVSDVIYKGMR